jgi:hypothetical protein
MDLIIIIIIIIVIAATTISGTANLNVMSLS